MAALVLLAALALGCTMHPVTEEPAPLVPGPDAWTLVSPAASADPAVGWWVAFDDAELSARIERALGDNLSVGRAWARLERADALTRQAASLYWPQIDAVATGSLASDRDDSFQRPYAAGAAMVWEVDLFGRLRSQASAAAAQRDATAWDLAATRLVLSAQVAEAWYGAVEQQLQLALLDEQRTLATTLVELTELRFAQGDASAVDVLQQRGQLEEVQSEFPIARARLRELENRLDVLLGEAPDGVPQTQPALAQLPTPRDVPPLGVPAELLVRRPDLASLGRVVVAADYEIAAAIADRLPRVVLDGTALFADPVMGAAGPAASLAGGLVQPLLDWGRREAGVDAARAVHQDALLAFSETYLVALEEVETTLWQERQQRDRLETLTRRVDVLKLTVEGTRWRYVQGITDYLPVLTAVRELQAAQRELLTGRRELVSLRIQLYRALGGAVP